MDRLAAVDVEYRGYASNRGVAIVRVPYVTFSVEPHSPVHRDRVVEIYVSEEENGAVDVYRYHGQAGNGGSCYVRVPPEALAAFSAGEDWRPLVDWLLEAYPDRLGWLSEIIGRVGA